MAKKIIVIEGPAGAGKGTAAWLLANKLKYLYVDTGAIYRGLALRAINTIHDVHNIQKVCNTINNCSLIYKNSDKESKTKNTILLNNENVTDKIRTQPVSMAASIIAGYPCVVNKVKEILQNVTTNQKIVAEGQTIAENLIPNHDLLIYLTASTEIRAERRFNELKEKDPNVTYSEVLESMHKRDYNDENREFNKMKIHPEAHIIDSSNMTIQEVVEKMYQLAM